jgi:methionyl-tRNA formyltransferase
VGAGHDVALVVTRPDKRRGRNEAPRPSPVKAAALGLGLPVSERVEDVLDAGAELGVVVAFGRIIQKAVLERLPLVNVHFSLLPRWRGAAPVERAIMAGDTVTGVCLMAVDEGLDTGAVYRRRSVDIEPGETADNLRARLSSAGADLLVEALAGGAAGLGTPVEQEGEPTYAAKIARADLRLDWSRPAWELERVVRVGRAWTTWRGKRLLVTAATAAAGPAELAGAGAGGPGALCGDLVAAGEGTWLRLVRVQPEGRQPLTAGEWLRGARVGPSEALGT